MSSQKMEWFPNVPPPTEDHMQDMTHLLMKLFEWQLAETAFPDVNRTDNLVVSLDAVDRDECHTEFVNECASAYIEYDAIIKHAIDPFQRLDYIVRFFQQYGDMRMKLGSEQTLARLTAKISEFLERMEPREERKEFHVFDFSNWNRELFDIPRPKYDDVQVFRAFPTEICFSKYKIGRIYKKKLKFQNISNVLQHCVILPPSSGAFSILPKVNCPSMSKGLVAPGQFFRYVVQFCAKEYGPIVNDEVSVISQSGKLLRVPLVSKDPEEVLRIPPSVDFGQIVVGMTAFVKIPILGAYSDLRITINLKNPETSINREDPLIQNESIIPEKVSSSSKEFCEAPKMANEESMTAQKEFDESETTAETNPAVDLIKPSFQFSSSKSLTETRFHFEDDLENPAKSKSDTTRGDSRNNIEPSVTIVADENVAQSAEVEEAETTGESSEDDNSLDPVDLETDQPSNQEPSSATPERQQSLATPERRQSSATPERQQSSATPERQQRSEKLVTTSVHGTPFTLKTEHIFAKKRNATYFPLYFSADVAGIKEGILEFQVNGSVVGTITMRAEAIHPRDVVEITGDWMEPEVMKSRDIFATRALCLKATGVQQHQDEVIQVLNRTSAFLSYSWRVLVPRVDPRDEWYNQKSDSRYNIKPASEGTLIPHDKATFVVGACNFDPKDPESHRVLLFTVRYRMFEEIYGAEDPFSDDGTSDYGSVILSSRRSRELVIKNFMEMKRDVFVFERPKTMSPLGDPTEHVIFADPEECSSSSWSIDVRLASSVPRVSLSPLAFNFMEPFVCQNDARKKTVRLENSSEFSVQFLWVGAMEPVRVDVEPNVGTIPARSGCSVEVSVTLETARVGTFKIGISCFIKGLNQPLMLYLNGRM